MAHYAEIDEGGTVVRVIVVANCECMDAEGNEIEELGRRFCQQNFGGTWIKTSYNGNIRKRYAGVGYTYDSLNDAFVAPRPYPSWTLDSQTLDWAPPVPRPSGGPYSWDEDGMSWVESPM